MHISDKIVEEAWEILKDYYYRRMGFQPFPSSTSEKWTCKDCEYWGTYSHTSEWRACTQIECSIAMSKGCQKACSYFMHKKQD